MCALRVNDNKELRNNVCYCLLFVYFFSNLLFSSLSVWVNIRFLYFVISVFILYKNITRYRIFANFVLAHVLLSYISLAGPIHQTLAHIILAPRSENQYSECLLFIMYMCCVNKLPLLTEPKTIILLNLQCRP